MPRDHLQRVYQWCQVPIKGPKSNLAIQTIVAKPWQRPDKILFTAWAATSCNPVESFECSSPFSGVNTVPKYDLNDGNTWTDISLNHCAVYLSVWYWQGIFLLENVQLLIQDGKIFWFKSCERLLTWLFRDGKMFCFKSSYLQACKI